jgi:type IV pilus assembly protein PilN
MYSLDVNFLKDRHLTEPGKTASPVKVSPGFDFRQNLPTFIGLGVGVALLAIAGLCGVFLNWQKAQTEEQVRALDAELGQLQGRSKKLQDLKKQLAAIEGENNALVGVFERIRPWSAILQEIRLQIPPTVSVSGIQQVDLPPDAAQGQTTGRTQLKISGFARDYEAVNHYLLTLQGSPFLKADKTAIESASEADLLIPLDPRPIASIPLPRSYLSLKPTVTVPKGVKYTIVAELQDTPVTRQLPSIARNGAVGVVTRIKTLERQGVLPP